MDYGAPVLRIDGEQETEPIVPTNSSSSSSPNFYPEGHPLARRGTPKRIVGHPIRTAETLTHRRIPRRQQQHQAQHQPNKRGHQQSPLPRTPPSKRAAWDSTNSDLSRYTLSEQELLRRKKLMRTPVDTGRTRSRRAKSVAPSPGGANGFKKKSGAAIATSTATTATTPATTQRSFTTPKKAWVPSGKTSGKGLVGRTPGFVDDSWKEYAKDLPEEENDDMAEIDTFHGQEEDSAEEEYNEIDRTADPYRTPSVAAAQKKQHAGRSTLSTVAGGAATRSSPSSFVSSFRKPVGTRLSLHTASKAWAKRKESHPDIFTAQDAEIMSALRNNSNATPASSSLPSRSAHSKLSTSQPPPRPMKASTELGRRQRAEQEGAFMELEAQLTRLRIVKGIEQTEQQHLNNTDDTMTAVSPSSNEDLAPAKHWISFHANMPTTNALLNNTSVNSTSSYNTRTMLTSLAHVASTLASSLAENEIRLQEESKARQNMQDVLLETQSELKHLKAQQSEDSDAIARMITQMPDIALNYLTSSPSQSAGTAGTAGINLDTAAEPADEMEMMEVAGVKVGETAATSVPTATASSTTLSTSEYGSLLGNHEATTATVRETDATIERLQTTNDIEAVASLPEMNMSLDQDDDAEEETVAMEQQMGNNRSDASAVQAGYKPRTTMQMGYTITEFVSSPIQNVEEVEVEKKRNEDEEMVRHDIPRPAPRTSVPMPTVLSGPGYRNAVLDSPLSASLGKINYSSYMKRPSSSVAKPTPRTPSPVRKKKTNAAAAWLNRKK
jgi:ElaB/YqjD/DUF883 family membrane-anchored ribosome-binding protein